MLSICENTPQPAPESTEVTILWDFSINTDRNIEANWPDITLKNFEEHACIMIDVIVPADKKLFLSISSTNFLNIKILKLRLQKSGNSKPKRFQL